MTRAAPPASWPDDRLLALVELLYAGLAEAKPWEPFLRALARETGANHATLLLGTLERGAPEAMVTPDADPRRMGDYADVLFASDPFVGLPEDQVVSFADFVDPAALSPEFKTYLASGDTPNILGVDLRNGAESEARIRLTRDTSLPDFGEEERGFLGRLVPHIRIALRLFERLQSSAAVEGVYRGAIEQLALGTIILDRKGRILRSNAVADRLLIERDGFAADNGVLRLTHREAQAELKRLLAAPPASGETAALRIPRPSGAAELGGVVRIVETPNARATSGAFLALFVRDPDAATRASPEVLRDLFQLTRAESILAAQLGNGISLAEAAGALGIAYNTARAQLRLIFAKTGAHRQSQLVSLLRSSVAGLSVGEPG